MTPKEKAKELVDRFAFNCRECDNARQCALIAVDEILESLSDIYIQGETDIDEVRIYYREVKEELDNL
jgi:hypothetical protein